MWVLWMPKCEFDKFSVAEWVKSVSALWVLEWWEFHEGSEAEFAKYKCDNCECQNAVSFDERSEADSL